MKAHQLAAVVLLLLFALSAARAERIKDLAMVGGVRSNQLIGYGLVVGLDGTGDQTTQTPFTIQSIRNMLQRFGVQIPAGTSAQLKNVAAVIISTALPAFARPGQTIDVTVSSIGNAKSLRGGMLLMAPLRGADGNVYAIAQGSLVVGGVGASGSDGSSVSVNIPSVGLVPNGATVERSVPDAFSKGDSIVLSLHSADFTTAQHVAEAINHKFGGGIAVPVDAGSVNVKAPTIAAQRVAFVSMLENLQVEPGRAPARVVVNSRTGTVVIGEDVRVLPAAVAHGSLTVTIAERPQVSQPAPLSKGTTTVVPRSGIDVSQEKARFFMLGGGASLKDIVRAVNEVGAGPDDLVAILEALRQAGALRAELVVI